jgi:hypothetical protein
MLLSGVRGGHCAGEERNKDSGHSDRERDSNGGGAEGTNQLTELYMATTEREMTETVLTMTLALVCTLSARPSSSALFVSFFFVPVLWLLLCCCT